MRLFLVSGFKGDTAGRVCGRNRKFSGARIRNYWLPRKNARESSPVEKFRQARSNAMSKSCVRLGKHGGCQLCAVGVSSRAGLRNVVVSFETLLAEAFKVSVKVLEPALAATWQVRLFT